MTVTEDAPAAAPTASEPTGRHPGALGPGRHPRLRRPQGRRPPVDRRRRCSTSSWSARQRSRSALERIDLSGVDIVDADWFGPARTLHRRSAAPSSSSLPLTIGLATAIVPLQVGASTIAFPAGRRRGGLDLPPRRRPARRRLRHRRRALRHRRRRRAPLRGRLRPRADRRGRGLGLHRHHRAPAAGARPLAGPGAAVRLVDARGRHGVAHHAPGARRRTVLAYLDVRYGGGQGIFGGGQATLYPRIAWVFGTPAVYAFAIPALGVVGSICRSSRRPGTSSTASRQGLVAAFGALSRRRLGRPRLRQRGLPLALRGARGWSCPSPSSCPSSACSGSGG